MKNTHIKTCLTIEFPELSLFDESAIANSLDNLLRKKSWGYYLGSKRIRTQVTGPGTYRVEFSFHMYTEHYREGGDSLRTN